MHNYFEFGPVVQKVMFLSFFLFLAILFIRAESLVQFVRRHNKGHLLDKGEISFKDIYNSGGHFVLIAQQNSLYNFSRGHYEEHF